MSNNGLKKSKQLATERVVGFIGGYLVDQGSITLEQLDHALVHQVELALQGESLSIGQVLLRLGYVTTQDLERAIKRQQQDIASRSKS